MELSENGAHPKCSKFIMGNPQKSMISYDFGVPPMTNPTFFPWLPWHLRPKEAQLRLQRRSQAPSLLVRAQLEMLQTHRGVAVGQQLLKEPVVPGRQLMKGQEISAVCI